MIAKVIHHFREFHKGTVNLFVHIIGFAGVLYSTYTLNWILFAGFIILLEFGHLYNHLTGIKEYDMRLKVLFWRVVTFAILVSTFFFITQYV